MEYLPQLMLAYTAYALLTLSPGPANLAIIATSMQHGRIAGLFVAAGVVTGSQFWALMAALGMTSVMQAFGWLTEIIRVLGGLFLLWLAWKSIKSAIHPGTISLANQEGRPSSLQFFLRGLGIHLMNPKAVFGWLSIISISVKAESPVWISAAVVMGCLLLGSIIFGLYAIVFSTPQVARGYLAGRRWIDSICAGFFALCGIKLILSRH